MGCSPEPRERLPFVDEEVHVPGPLRVFVSSTMNDLANERAAVVARLHEFNFEPVNAESVVPTGRGSWEVLEDEIASCDVFVLILGDRYGWIPTDGPHARDGLSVTELEYRAARRLGLPVFPFFKKLNYGSPAETADAKARDEFRREVSAWNHGHFKVDFELALDLAPLVSKSIVHFLTERSRRTADVRRPTATPPARVPAAKHLIALPNELVKAVADRSAILLAGAGMSLQAGLPSAAVFTETLLQRIQEVDPTYVRGGHGSDLNSVASDLERLLGPDALQAALGDLMALQHTTSPSNSQEIAVDSFDLVVTTNYDTLLERADIRSRLDVVDRELERPLATSSLVKLHGSLDDPQWLVVTRKDLDVHSERRRRLLEAIRQQLRSRPLVVVGSSLRDPSTVRLIDECRPDIHGWMITPTLNEVDRLRATDWNLVPVIATADDFFLSLHQSLND
jgi:Domain of unknown function (DUF4062)/SIR2-like domain